MAVATLEAIRDRVAVLITAITPTINSGDKFEQSQDERNADFQQQSEEQPLGAFRRFQVRSSGDEEPPSVSNTDQSRVEATMIVTVAYPHNKQAGPVSGRDRDDCIDSDWKLINYRIGIYGRANFSSTNDCAPMGGEKFVERGDACDFLVIRMRLSYVVDVDG